MNNLEASKWSKFDYSFVNNLWNKALSNNKPSSVHDIEIVDFEIVLSKFQSNNKEFITEIISKLADGYFIVLRNSFSVFEIEKIKSEFIKLEENTESTFHKMIEGVPNYYRNITEELSNKYAVPVVKKSAYFFPMNEDSNEMFNLVYPRWRLCKALSGLSPFEFEELTPKDGKVDRIQVVKYPPGSGFLDAHHDPEHNQRLIMSCYLTKEGRDFTGGGFWAQMQSGERRNFENVLQPGDIGLCFAHVIHGVDSSERSANGENNKPYSDRWFMGLYTNDSDTIDNRITLRKA